MKTYRCLSMRRPGEPNTPPSKVNEIIYARHSAQTCGRKSIMSKTLALGEAMVNLAYFQKPSSTHQSNLMDNVFRNLRSIQTNLKDCIAGITNIQPRMAELELFKTKDIQIRIETKTLKTTSINTILALNLMEMICMRRMNTSRCISMDTRITSCTSDPMKTTSMSFKSQNADLTSMRCLHLTRQAWAANQRPIYFQAKL